MDFLFGSKIVASLDIGSYSLKWAAVDRRKGTCHIWSAELFPDRQSRKDVLDEGALTQRLVSLLGECQKAVGAWSKKVICSAYGNKVFYGYLEVGLTSPKFLRQAVTSAMMNSLPYPLDELQVETVPVEPLSGRTDKSGAFYCMLHISLIERLRRRVEACGLKLDGACVVPIALARAWGKNRGGEIQDFVALVDIGFDKTMVVVVRGEQPYYVREVPIAGGQFTYAFQVEEHVPWQVAENNKRNYNVHQTREHFIEPDLRKWLEELKRSVGHFESKYAEFGRRVSHIVLSGGGACWQGLEKRVEEHLGLPVVVDGWSKIRPLEPRSDDEALLHKISIGATLS